MRFWLLCILLVSPLFSSSDTLLLRAEASIFPKLLLLAKEPQKLLINGTIVIAIIYEEEETESASELKALMQEQYNGFVEGYSLNIVLIKYPDLNATLQASALIALPSQKHINEPARVAIKNKIISYVSDVAYLKEGYLFSLNLERSTVVYMNKGVLPSYGVEFSDTLYHVVRFFDENKEGTLPLD